MSNEEKVLVYPVLHKNKYSYPIIKGDAVVINLV